MIRVVLFIIKSFTGTIYRLKGKIIKYPSGGKTIGLWDGQRIVHSKTMRRLMSLDNEI